jgi:hypothetical protein
VTPIVVASVARIALQNPHANLIRDLDSQTLDRIGDSFFRILDKRTLSIWSFSEGHREGVYVAYMRSNACNLY